MNEQTADVNDRAAKRRLAHAMRNYLFIVDMGLEAIAASDGDREEVEKIVENVRAEGLKPLGEAIDQIGDLGEDSGS